jgi:hypothetical protein
VNVFDPSKSSPEVERQELNTPAYLRRRKNLFE